MDSPVYLFSWLAKVIISSWLYLLGLLVLHEGLVRLSKLPWFGTGMTSAKNGSATFSKFKNPLLDPLKLGQ